MGVKNMAEKGGETGRGREWEKRRKEQAERTELWWEKGLVGQKKIENKIEKKRGKKIARERWREKNTEETKREEKEKKKRRKREE